MQKTAQFSKSRVPCLVRHRGGTYYVSAKVSGKLIRRSLETDDYGTAVIRLPGELEKIRGAKNASTAGQLGTAIHDEAHREDPAIKPTMTRAEDIQNIMAEIPAGSDGDTITQALMEKMRIGQAAADLLEMIEAQD